MKDLLTVIGAGGLMFAIAAGVLLFVAGIYFAVFGSIAGVIYLFIKGVLGLFS